MVRKILVSLAIVLTLSTVGLVSMAVVTDVPPRVYADGCQASCCGETSCSGSGECVCSCTCDTCTCEPTGGGDGEGMGIWDWIQIGISIIDVIT